MIEESDAGPKSNSAKKMKVKAIVTLLVLIVAVSALATHGLMRSALFRETKKNVVSEPAREVTIMRVKKKNVELTLPGSGDARPYEEALIGSKASGIIEKLLFDEGDHVKKGDVLAEIEHEELEFQLHKAEALLAVAEANLAKAKVPYRPEEIRSLEANLERAEASLEDAKLDLNRARNLWRSRTIAQDEVDDAQSQLRIKTAEYTDALEKLNLAKAGGREEDVKIAEGEVRERQAELGIANQNLSDTRILSELDGSIAARYVSRGERVNLGSPIASVVDISKIKVEMFVPEMDFARVQRGNPARITLRAFPGRTFEGAVSLTGVSADTKTRTFKLEILVDNHEERIRPGMTAEVTLVWDKRDSTITVPERAILSENGEKYVYLANSAVCVKQKVVPGLNQRGAVVIEDGLKENDAVVISGQELLSDGAKVKIIAEE